MRLLSRYVLKEILVTAFIAVTVLSVVIVLGNLQRKLDLLVNHDVPLEYLLRFIGYILPFSLVYTIPWGFLTAVLLVYGRLSAENELLAIRTSGISLLRFSAPVIVLSVLLSALCLWLNLSVAPKAQNAMRDTIFRLATKDPLSLFGSDQVIDQFPNRRIYVGKRDGDRLENIQVVEMNEESEPVRVLFAESGRVVVDLEQKQVLMRLNGAQYEERDKQNPGNLRAIRHGITMDQGTFPISLEELYKKSEKGRGLSSLTYSELSVDLKEKSGTSSERMGTRTEVYKRLSFSLACVTFCLVGVPLGVTAHRKETSIGFALSLVVASSFFMLIQLADSQKFNVNFHPDLVVWVPNIVFIGLGIWLFVRQNRR